MANLDTDEYSILDIFVKTAFRRVEAGTMKASEAHSDMMHVLTALDKGNMGQFAPYMSMRLKDWNGTTG